MILPDIKLFLTDIDGVWTDAGMYYSECGMELKKYSTYDSMGVKLCKVNNIEVGIITGENSKSVLHRAKKLTINICRLGVRNKLKEAYKIIEELKIESLRNVAYIGDDFNDLKLLESVGISACPSQSSAFISKIVDWRLNSKGGDGAFREFVEKYLIAKNKLIASYDKIVDELNL